MQRTPQKRLEQMIEYDEEQAAAILKQWIMRSETGMKVIPLARYLADFERDGDRSRSACTANAEPDRAIQR